jgi:hypothetical protein
MARLVLLLLLSVASMVMGEDGVMLRVRVVVTAKGQRATRRTFPDRSIHSIVAPNRAKIAPRSIDRSIDAFECGPNRAPIDRSIDSFDRRPKPKPKRTQHATQWLGNSMTDDDPPCLTPSRTPTPRARRRQTGRRPRTRGASARRGDARG